MNIPNLLTLLRIILIPVLVILLIKGQLESAFIIFVIAAVSDGLDGMIARFFNQRTRFGAYFDPIADKLLIDTAYVTLAILSLLPTWLAVIVCSRDALILLGIMSLKLMARPVEIKPVWDSKITTCLQLATICFFFEPSLLHPFQLVKDPLVLLTAVFTVVSGGHYIVVGFKVIGIGGAHK